MKYKELQRQYDELKKKNLEKYMSEKVESLKTTDPSRFFKKIKKLGETPGESSETFRIAEHVEKDLSPTESAERIAEKFSDINKKLPPLDISTLPERVRERIHDVIRKKSQFSQNTKSSRDLRKGK